MAEDVAEKNFHLLLRAARLAAREIERYSVEAARAARRWAKDIEKRTANGLVSEEQAYREKMDLESKILNIHIEKAQERGMLSPEDAMDLKEHIETLKGAKGLQNSREASYELSHILEQYKNADFKTRQGVPAKDAYKGIKDAPLNAVNARKVFFNSLEQIVKKLQDQIREQVAERVR